MEKSHFRNKQSTSSFHQKTLAFSNALSHFSSLKPTTKPSLKDISFENLPTLRTENNKCEEHFDNQHLINKTEKATVLPTQLRLSVKGVNISTVLNQLSESASSKTKPLNFLTVSTIFKDPLVVNTPIQEIKDDLSDRSISAFEKLRKHTEDFTDSLQSSPGNSKPSALNKETPSKQSGNAILIEDSPVQEFKSLIGSSFLSENPKSLLYSSKKKSSRLEISPFSINKPNILKNSLASVSSVSAASDESLIYSSILSFHPELSSSHRAILLDWLSEVSEELFYKHDTYHLTVSIIDRYLAASSDIKLEDLQLIGIVCLSLASKLEVIS